MNCMDEEGNHPMFVNVNMHTGQLATTWIDALQASFSAVQVLRGDIDEAICLHALYYSIWKKFVYQSLKYASYKKAMTYFDCIKKNHIKEKPQ